MLRNETLHATRTTLYNYICSNTMPFDISDTTSIGGRKRISSPKLRRLYSIPICGMSGERTSPYAIPKRITQKRSKIRRRTSMHDELQSLRHATRKSEMVSTSLKVDQQTVQPTSMDSRTITTRSMSLHLHQGQRNMLREYLL